MVMVINIVIVIGCFFYIYMNISLIKDAHNIKLVNSFKFEL